MKDGRDPLLQIRVHYDLFRKSEKRVADYILSAPHEIIHLSITTLAERCQVSETSVIRLCKKIGYPGFQNLKINVAMSVVTPAKQIHEAAIESDSVADLIQKILSANKAAIENTMQILNPAQIEKAIDAIANTKRLEFYGMGGSGAVAVDAQHKFFKYGIACVAYSDTHMQAMSASTMQKGDIAFAISHGGSSIDLVDNLKVAKEVGATTITITGGIKSPITKVSDIVLAAIAEEQSYKFEPMSSRIAQLCIIDVLAVGVALRRQKIVLENMRKSRQAVASKRY
ncbi:MAG: MurR/RpiR family transcriptional regulator [Defluviitaleaceae bacterium]|nr:MurR/RpiR family transcriptional regulator [Defluviitaleaceae bacterium]